MLLAKTAEVHIHSRQLYVIYTANNSHIVYLLVHTLPSHIYKEECTKSWWVQTMTTVSGSHHLGTKRSGVEKATKLVHYSPEVLYIPQMYYCIYSIVKLPPKYSAVYYNCVHATQRQTSQLHPGQLFFLGKKELLWLWCGPTTFYSLNHYHSLSTRKRLRLW